MCYGPNHAKCYGSGRGPIIIYVYVYVYPIYMHGIMHAYGIPLGPAMIASNEESTIPHSCFTALRTWPVGDCVSWGRALYSAQVFRRNDE